MTTYYADKVTVSVNGNPVMDLTNVPIHYCLDIDQDYDYGTFICDGITSSSNWVYVPINVFRFTAPSHIKRLMKQAYEQARKITKPDKRQRRKIRRLKKAQKDKV